MFMNLSGAAEMRCEKFLDNMERGHPARKDCFAV
jgi:hypothetical protein